MVFPTDFIMLCEFFEFCVFDGIEEICMWLLLEKKRKNCPFRLRENYYKMPVIHEQWIDSYHDRVFFQLFRLKKESFHILLEIILENDKNHLIKKKYRGGNYPLAPHTSLLVFLWYMAREDTLQAIGDKFSLASSTVMQLVNAYLFILIGLKKKYIFWPRNDEEFNFIKNGFKNYPGVVGAVDGSHINIRVPNNQHDSYVDRYLSHSINLMAICSANKIFTYVFIGFPGSAHDSRVFSNSTFVRNIERFGSTIYFPSEDLHIIGDSAFPIKSWLMTPFKFGDNFGRMKKNHNYLLSADRVVSENTFGILKGRWKRLQFINTCSISKSIEITTAACILHNFCYLNNDTWDGELYTEEIPNEQIYDDREDSILGKEKREYIARQLLLRD